MILLLLIWAIGLGLIACKRQRLGWLVNASLLLILLGMGCGLIPSMLLAHLQASYVNPPEIRWGKRNTIVLLGGGNSRIPSTGHLEINPTVYSRVIQSFSLYKTCKRVSNSCTILISGGDVQHYGTSEAEIYGNYLNQLGTPRSDLTLESRSMNTWQNAQFTQPILKQSAPDRVIVVTSGIHLRRSVIYFSHFGIQTIPVRSDYLSAHISLLPTAYNMALTEFALHEYLGILRYKVYNVLGWNVTAQQPGSI